MYEGWRDPWLWWREERAEEDPLEGELRHVDSSPTLEKIILQVVLVRCGQKEEGRVYGRDYVK